MNTSERVTTGRYGMFVGMLGSFNRLGSLFYLQARPPSQAFDLAENGLTPNQLAILYMLFCCKFLHIWLKSAKDTYPKPYAPEASILPPDKRALKWTNLRAVVRCLEKQNSHTDVSQICEIRLGYQAISGYQSSLVDRNIRNRLAMS